jgi:steroid 5-alpha reductase family enzyme
MSLLAVTLTVLAVIFASVTILWLVSLALRNSSIVDIYWGAGFVVANWVAFGLGEGYLPRKLLLATLVTLWGLRLTGYILWRNWGKEEDFRYRKWRDEAGSSWWWKSLFKVFLLQGALQAMVAAPLIVAHTHPGVPRLTFLDFAAAALWLIGFVFEVSGDWQLARFRADPSNRGKLLHTGVWRYTRHPNYFGDAAQWWGFYLIAAATGGGAATIFSPILMTFLLVRISGVGLLEKTLRDKKPGYREYMETTSAFIPWFPKRPSPQGHQQGA